MKLEGVYSVLPTAFTAAGDLDDATHDYANGAFGLQISPARPTAASEPATRSPGELARRHAERINAIQRFFVERTRLGITPIRGNDQLIQVRHGRGARRARVSELARLEIESSQGATVVRVIGEIDLSNASEMLDAVIKAVPSHETRVVLAAATYSHSYQVGNRAPRHSQ